MRELDSMARRARCEYGTRIKNYIAFGKKDYLQGMNGQMQLRRQQAQGRTLSSILGTTIFGFPKGKSWEFYYQTWGKIIEETPPPVNTPTPPNRTRRRWGLFSSLCEPEDLLELPRLQVPTVTDPFRVFYSGRIG